MNDMSNVKVGDVLVVGGGWSVRLERVTRVTPTRVICNAQQYRKKDGRRVGDGSWASYARLATDADFMEQRREKAVSTLTGLRSSDLSGVPLDVLEAIVAQLAAARRPGPAPEPGGET